MITPKWENIPLFLAYIFYGASDLMDNPRFNERYSNALIEWRQEKWTDLCYFTEDGRIFYITSKLNT